MKSILENKLKPCESASTDKWFIVMGNKDKLPFNFKEANSKKFYPIDFGIFALFNSATARSYFSSILMDTFEYNLNALMDITGENPKESLKDFTDNIDDYPWLKNELVQWGSIFSSLWVLPPQEYDPLIYKLISPCFRDWKINEPWLCKDGFTPRTYRFSELFFQEKSIFIVDEDLEEDELKHTCNVASPNIGTQFEDDDRGLFLLPYKWGFDNNGKLTYVGGNKT